MIFNELKNQTPYSILEKFDLKTPPFDPFYIAKMLNINVSQDMDFENVEVDGKISLDADKKPIIWINPLKNERRQRFTLAHELGHLANDILPSIDNPIIDTNITFYRGIFFTNNEIRANDFAAKLLMPLWAVESFLDEIRAKNPKITGKEIIQAIAVRFEVSKQAVFYRLKNIGLIRPETKYPF